MSQTKTLAELTIKNNFLFSAVMLDPENCRGLLEIILGIPIDRVIVSREQCLIYHPPVSYTHLDVYKRQAKNISATSLTGQDLKSSEDGRCAA